MILAEKLGGVHPVVYALLPDKTEATYTRFFAQLNRIQNGLNPQCVSCDFELAVINYVRNTYPNAEIHGCFYHLTRNMKKKVIF